MRGRSDYRDVVQILPQPYMGWMFIGIYLSCLVSFTFSVRCGWFFEPTPPNLMDRNVLCECGLSGFRLDRIFWRHSCRTSYNYKSSYFHLCNPWPHLDFLKLPKLNDVSQMLIAQVHSFMCVYRLEGGGVGFKGQILNVEQDISNLVRDLPLLPEEVPCFLVRKPNQSCPRGHRDFRVKRANIIAWLAFFKRYNPHYAHMNLDAAIQRASNLPEDGSIADSLRSVEFEEELNDSDDIDDSVHAENEATEQDLAPESGGASGEDSVRVIIDEVVKHDHLQLIFP